MIIERKHKTLIQQLAKYCFQATSSNDIISHTKSVVHFFHEVYPRKVKTFLNYFLICLQKEFERKHVIVQHSGSFNLKQLERFIAKTKTQESVLMVTEEHPELISGIKLQQGDTVWDFSIQGQLQSLMKTLK